MKKLNILVACEESQAVTRELRLLGHNAYSCDLLPCSGGHPEWHFNFDVFQVIENRGGTLQNGRIISIQNNWDLMIAHPPCTYLAVSGARWFYHPDDRLLPVNNRRPHPKFPNREQDRNDALEFFIALYNSPIEKIAIENPIGTVNTKFKKPNQIIHPYQFGESASKATCLWLKNLPNLEPTLIVDKGPRTIFKSGKSQPKWYSDALINAKTTEERRTLRSKTFNGIARAMAEQWTRPENY